MYRFSIDYDDLTKISNTLKKIPAGLPEDGNFVELILFHYNEDSNTNKIANVLPITLKEYDIGDYSVSDVFVGHSQNDNVPCYDKELSIDYVAEIQSIVILASAKSAVAKDCILDIIKATTNKTFNRCAWYHQSIAINNGCINCPRYVKCLSEGVDVIV